MDFLRTLKKRKQEVRYQVNAASPVESWTKAKTCRRKKNTESELSE